MNINKMSGTWSGFSEEDIKKLKNKSTKVKGQTHFHKITEETQIPQTTLMPKSNTVTTSAEYEIPEDAKLSPSANQEDKSKPNVLSSNENNETQVNADNKLISPTTNIVNTDLSSTLGTTDITSKLDEFHTKQTLMKEQNRKRKELLSKALADRTRKTVEETKRLNEIKEEFKKLDALLSNDVSVLRYEIEVASIEFMEAQKRYHRIEKEFLEAKLLLHNKLERKELLTEHLCAIIEKNEERKAEKLSDLLGRLEVDKVDTEDYVKT